MLNKQFDLKFSDRTGLVVVFLFFVCPVAFLIYLSSSIPSPEKPSTSLSDTPYQRVIEVAQQASPNASVLVLGNGEAVGSSAQPPYEVIVNLSEVDCFDAKVQLLDVMRSLYTDSITKSNISRVLVNANGQLSASLGVEDVRSLSTEQWRSNGPSNFFGVLLEMGNRSNENLPMQQRTWGSSVDGCK